MRKLIAHNFVTLDGVAVIDNVIGTIVELRDTPRCSTASSPAWRRRTRCCSGA